ncbi:MAG: efflux RND transporter permease subunit [Prolixibacteraceae bacterium]
MNLSELAVKRPTLVVVLFTILVFLGGMSFTSLNYELFPEFASPVFTISTVYPGAGPSEVENSVSKQIEEAVSGLSGVENIRSISQEGVSMVIVELSLKADVDVVVNEAVRKVQSVRSLFPPQVLEPAISKFSVDDLPIISLSVNAGLPAFELYDELNYRIIPALAKNEGVGEVSLLGGTEREIQVNIDHKKLDNHNLSVLQVVQAIRVSNIDFPAGKISSGNRQTMLRMSAKYTRVPDIANLIVSQMPDGSLVKLKDIAEVTDTEKDATSVYRVNGSQAVGLQIKKQEDANAVAVSNAVKQEIARLTKQYSDISLEFTVPQDGSIIIMDAARSVGFDLLLAVILVTFVMFFFLHSGRNAVIIMVAVPLSLVASFTGMALLGYSLNLMTLLAMSLVIGTLVDDAIVVLENIYRHLEMGKTSWQATIDGVKEIGLSVIAITLVLIVVFLPVALSESMISPIIAPLAMVIVITVLLSLLVAFTVVPLITSRFSKLEKLNRKTWWGKLIELFEKGVDSFSRLIMRLLCWSLQHKFATLGIATLLFVSSLMLPAGGFIGTEFMSAGDMGECIVTVEYPKIFTLKQNNQATRKIEEIISQKPEVVKLYTTVGSTSGMLMSQSGNYKSEINIKLVDKTRREQSSAVFVKELEREINETFPDVKARSSVVSMIGGADEAPVQIVFQATNTDTLFAFAEIMRKQIAQIPGTNNVKLSIEGGSPEVVIKPDKDKMARLGLSPEVVGATIQTSFSGNTDSKFKTGDYEYDINVRLDAFNRRSVADVENLTILNNAGQTVKLKQFAAITEQTGYSNLERYGRISSVMLESQALGRAVGDIGDDLIKLLENTEFPEGVSYLPEGDLKYQDDAFGSLGAALLIAIVLVYLIMVALYESYLHPFVVLFSIPLSIIGALYALALSQQSLSLFSMLGIIILVGLVTKNAILVVDFANQLRKEGKIMKEALVTAVQLRLRPILMTAISTVVGMLPIALSHGAGSEWKNGLGWVLIGGMTSSMLLTLIVVPVVYLVAEEAKSLVAAHLFYRSPIMDLKP